MPKPNRRSISIGVACYDQLRAYAEPRKIPVSQVVEQALSAVIAGVVPLAPAESSADRGIATKIARGIYKASRAQARAQATEKRQLQIALRAKLRAARSQPPTPIDRLSTPAAIRALQSGPPPSKMFPPGAFCGVCAENCTGLLYQEPIGKNDSMVNVCERCQLQPIASNRT